MSGPEILFGDPIAALRDGVALGRPVVAVIGWGVPTELVEAADATMLRVLPRLGHATPLADALVGTGESEETRALLEPVLDGSLGFCALLVVTRAHEWVYYFIKEAVRMGAGEGRTIPPVHLHDFVASTESSLRPFNLQQMAHLEVAISRQLGVQPDSAGWERAIAAGNDRRALFRRLADLRGVGTVSGAEAVRLAATSSARDMRSFVAEASRWLDKHPGHQARARLLLLASEDDDDGAVHEVVEAAGAIIVAEDGEWGIRTATPALEADRDPMDLLADAMLDAATGPSVSPRERRLNWAMGALDRDDIDAVVFSIPPRDQRFGWDYPALRARAADLGLLQLLLTVDARSSPAAATQVVAEFLSTLITEPPA